MEAQCATRAGRICVLAEEFLSTILFRAEFVNEPSETAAEFSPGRKPGDRTPWNSEPALAGDRPISQMSFPEKLLSPLQGSSSYFRVVPGLTPGATFYRHLRWLIEWFIFVLPI